jgi:zinc protease
MKLNYYLIPIFILLIACGTTNKQIEQIKIAEESIPQLSDYIPIDKNVTIGNLDNGIKYYIRQNKKPENRAQLRLVINVGSILEDKDQQGLAHFVEHMCFNGTEHFQKQELIDFLESIGMRFGADINAYTSFDETVYMLQLPTDSLELVDKGFLVLQDWAHAVSFDSVEINKERGVILEERRLGRGAAARMRDKQLPVLLKDSKYAERLPIGQKAVLDTFHHESLTSFYREWYRPDLMAVIAVGDFDVATIENLIKAHFSQIKSSDKPRERKIFPVPDHNETLFSIASDVEATQTRASIYYKLPLVKERTVQDYRDQLVESIYNAMFNKRLQELQKQPDPPFIFGSSGKGNFVRSKDFYALSCMVKDNGLKRGLETILKEARRVKLHGFTATELERQKKSAMRRMERAFKESDKAESRRYASEYIRNFLTEEPMPGIEYEFEIYKTYLNGITLEEVNALAGKWIKDSSRVITVTHPEREGIEEITEQQLSAILNSTDQIAVEPYVDDVLDEPLLDKIPMPSEIIKESYNEKLELTEWQLANGIKIYLKPTDFKNDQIMLTSTSPGGLSLIPDSLIVAAQTATTVIQQGGIGKFSDTQLKKLLADKVVSASPYIGQLTEGVYASSSINDVETMFQLIYLYFTSLRKDSTAFNAYRDRMSAMIKNKSLSPESAYGDTINVTLTQNNPRYKPWTSETLDQMDIDKSIDIYLDRFADASDFTFFMVGNLDLEKIKPLVKTYLGGLPVTNREEKWKDVSYEYPTGIIEKKVYRGKEPKCYSTIVFTGDFEWNRKNRVVADAMLDVLQIKLREKLREDLGGTYGVSVYGSYPHYPKEEYSINIRFGSDPQRVNELKSVVFTQIDSLKNYLVDEDYLNKVKEIYYRDYESNLKENRFWLNNLEHKFFHNEDMNEILDYANLVKSISLANIQRAAAKYFNMNNYVRVTLFPEEWMMQ